MEAANIRAVSRRSMAYNRFGQAPAYPSVNLPSDCKHPGLPQHPTISRKLPQGRQLLKCDVLSLAPGGRCRLLYLAGKGVNVISWNGSLAAGIRHAPAPEAAGAEFSRGVVRWPGLFSRFQQCPELEAARMDSYQRRPSSGWPWTTTKPSIKEPDVGSSSVKCTGLTLRVMINPVVRLHRRSRLRGESRIGPARLNLPWTGPT